LKPIKKCSDIIFYLAAINKVVNSKQLLFTCAKRR